jgi:hypothetical protein
VVFHVANQETAKAGEAGKRVSGQRREPSGDSGVCEVGMKTNTITPSSRALTRFSPAFVVCGALALFAGCASGPDSHVVSAPPPPAPVPVTSTVVTTTQTSPATPMVVQQQGQTYVTTTAQPNPTVSTVIITQAPPALQQEVVLARPSSDHVWIAGYWTWRNNRYEWMAGHWELPPSVSSKWMAPRWEQEGTGYRFYEGYWN